MTETEINDFIGAIANASVANDNTKLKLSELAGIFTILEIESNLCDTYKSRTDAPIRKAYDQFNNNPNGQTTALNIKNTYIKKNCTPLIP